VKLADGYRKIGQTAHGLACVAEAETFLVHAGLDFYAAEVHSLKGELTLLAHSQSAESGRTEAEACFQRAIELAQQQEGKSWELRAATSLARLWQQQGKTTEARDLLAPVYNWFTEGFDTADLKDAKTLLDQLS
jgi:predicted ATPase